MARILIIDDDRQVRTMLKMVLEREGHTVTTADNGVVGIKLFKETNAQLVISDIIMPEKEGIEVIVEIKSLNDKTKIMAISGGGRISSGNYLSLAQTLGADTVLHKPVERQELINEVNNLLNQ